MRKVFIFLVTFISLLGISFLAIPIAMVANAGVISVTIQNPISATSFSDLFENYILRTIFGLITGVAVIMLVYAGILFLISGGSPNMVQRAKTALTYAIIGLVIALAAWGITELVRTVLGVRS